MVPKLGSSDRKLGWMKMFSSLPIKLPIAGVEGGLPEWAITSAVYNCSDPMCGCTRWTMTSSGGRKINLDLYSVYHGHALEALGEFLQGEKLGAPVPDWVDEDEWQLKPPPPPIWGVFPIASVKNLIPGSYIGYA